LNRGAWSREVSANGARVPTSLRFRDDFNEEHPHDGSSQDCVPWSTTDPVRRAEEGLVPHGIDDENAAVQRAN